MKPERLMDMCWTLFLEIWLMICFSVVWCWKNKNHNKSHHCIFVLILSVQKVNLSKDISLVRLLILRLPPCENNGSGPVTSELRKWHHTSLLNNMLQRKETVSVFSYQYFIVFVVRLTSSDSIVQFCFMNKWNCCLV